MSHWHWTMEKTVLSSQDESLGVSQALHPRSETLTGGGAHKTKMTRLHQKEFSRLSEVSPETWDGDGWETTLPDHSVCFCTEKDLVQNGFMPSLPSSWPIWDLLRAGCLQGLPAHSLCLCSTELMSLGQQWWGFHMFASTF